MSRRVPGTVALIGFMGAGKSTVGRILARRLGVDFVDLDELIVARAGAPIARIFETEGEEAFRRIESECLASQAQQPPRVVATGGGAPIRPENRPLFRSFARTFYLELPFAQIATRVVNDGTRPLLSRPREELEAMYAARRPVYEELGEKIPTANRTPDEVAALILERLHTGSASPG